MNDNKSPQVEIESTGDGRYRVTVNGKPATGPLPRLDAARVADRLEGTPQPPSRRSMFPVILWISIGAGAIAGALDGDIMTGALFALGMFTVASVVFLFRTSD